MSRLCPRERERCRRGTKTLATREAARFFAAADSFPNDGAPLTQNRRSFILVLLSSHNRGYPRVGNGRTHPVAP